MNADAFRYLYNYHFTWNHHIWEISKKYLTPEQFNQPVAYAHGSVRSQFVHLISVDQAWFRDLGGLMAADPPDLDEQKDLENLWAYMEQVELTMRAYLADLRDDMLLTKPIPEGEDKDLYLWQILIHVINHGTDHRAQILRTLSDLGAKTDSQDFIFYVYDNP